MAKMRRTVANSLTAAGIVFAAAALLTAATAADDRSGTAHASGKVILQSVGPGIPVDGNKAALKLSDQERDHIRDVLKTQHTATSFALKEAKSAESFEPKVDATIPKGLKGQAFPQPLISDMPNIRRFTYFKFKDQVLIVDPMTRKIVDMFPEKS